mgnify:CR=1 FL=1
MSLLDKQTPVVTPEQAAARRQADINRKVQFLLSTPISTFNNNLSALTAGMTALWDDEHPQDILDGLGNKGAELFQLSALLAQFLVGAVELAATGDSATALSAKINAALAKIKPYTVANGKVTLNS